MSSHKKKAAGGSSTSTPAARSIPTLADSVVLATIRPGQFLVSPKHPPPPAAHSALPVPPEPPADPEYTLYKFVRLTGSSAVIVEYDPPSASYAAAAAAPPVVSPPAVEVEKEWGELYLPVRPTALQVGLDVYALSVEVGGLTSVYYEATLQAVAKGRSKAKERVVQFRDGSVQTLPLDALWEGITVPAIMLVGLQSPLPLLPHWQRQHRL